MTIPVITVLFTSHNGAGWIDRVLERYVAQDFEEPWQLIVAENGSKDDTAKILKSYATKLPLTVISVPVPGQNRARNAALPLIEADFVVMSDDDALPHENFLRGWAAVRKQHLDYDLFGGKIVAEFEAPPPKWVLRLARKSEAAFAQRDLPIGPIEAPKIFSPNMAIRRRVFDGGMDFNEAVGPNALDPNYPTGSETDFLRRAAAAGYKAMFVQGPVVSHIVRPHQATLAHFKAQARRDGRSAAQLERREGALRASAWNDKPLRRHVPARLQLEILRARALLSIDNAKRCFRWWSYHWWHSYLEERASPTAPLTLTPGGG